jgi:hypothetical protein
MQRANVEVHESLEKVRKEAKSAQRSVNPCLHPHPNPNPKPHAHPKPKPHSNPLSAPQKTIGSAEQV